MEILHGKTKSEGAQLTNINNFMGLDHRWRTGRHGSLLGLSLLECVSCMLWGHKLHPCPHKTDSVHKPD